MIKLKGEKNYSNNKPTIISLIKQHCKRNSYGNYDLIIPL